MKKLISFLMILVLCLSMALPVAAEVSLPAEAIVVEAEPVPGAGKPFSWDSLVAAIKTIARTLQEALTGVKETAEEVAATEPAGLTYTVDFTGAVPAETGSRKLSDAELKKLSGKTPEEAASSISTLADAYAWLKQEGYIIIGASLENRGEGIVGLPVRYDKVCWTALSNVINILLENDYDEVGTLLCLQVSDDKAWAYYPMSFNYVKTGGWYYVTDPTCFLPIDCMVFCHTLTIKIKDMADILLPLQDVNPDFVPLTLALVPLHLQSIHTTVKTDPLVVDVPAGRILYQADADTLKEYEEREEQQRADEMAAWDARARRINVKNYNIPAAIGQQNLTYDEAKALVGQDPAVIADRVKSVADALQYMIAARFGYYSEFFGTPWYETGNRGFFWGFDAPGDWQIAENYGCCCGGYANAASFLLQGDFEKVGTLRWVGGGNHTISWVYTGGKYYVFDFTQYSTGGNYNNYRCPVTVLDRLEDFYDAMPDTYSYFPKSEVVLMVAFEAGEAMYPSNWQDPPHFTGLTFPKEAEGKITLIYQKDPAYGVKYKDLDITIPGWND